MGSSGFCDDERNVYPSPYGRNLNFTSIIPFIEKLNIKFVSTIIFSINGYMDLQFLGGWTLYFVLGYYPNIVILSAGFFAV